MGEYKLTTTEEYIEKTGVIADKIYSTKEAFEIINNNCAAIFRGRVKPTDNEAISGKEIVDRLCYIEKMLSDAIDKACEEENNG